MIGSTFYYAPIDAKQGFKTALFYDDDVFPTLELDVLQTPDFEMMLSDSALAWIVGEPKYFDGEEGAAIFEVNPAASKFVLNFSTEDEATQADLDRFKAFVIRHGAASIYESATF